MNMLALTIILPLIGFVLLAFSRGRWSENVSAIVGVGSVGLAALVTAFIGVDFFANGEQSYSQPLWTWMSVGDFNIGFNLVLDGLSLTMLSVVTGVGFLIHMYASWYMRGEEGYSRFFAYTSDHREHGQRQAVQHQIETDVKVAYRHPRPQRLAV